MMGNCVKLLLLSLFVIKICLISQINADIEEDSWLDPDAWARDYLSSGAPQASSDKCKCLENILLENLDPKEPLKEQTAAEDTASLIYFKKLISMLFNRKLFKYDSTQQIYERSIVFSIQSSQMDKLEQLQDPRDLDRILAEVFNNIRISNTYCNGQQQSHTSETSAAFMTILSNILYDMWQITKTSEIRFLLVVAIVILTAWIFNTRFNIGLLPLVVGGIFIYGYLHTYLECNREIEVNQMLEILNRGQGSEKKPKGFKFINFFKGMFYSDEEEALQQQRIKQSAKLSLRFCRPDHVLIMYFNDIFFKYLQALIEQCSVTLTSLNGALGFPYNILSGILLVYMVGYTTKLTFKYIFSPSAWARFAHRKRSYTQGQATIKGIINSQDDRISGDNLKLFLNAINAAPKRAADAPKLPNASSVSGVEDVREAIEANSVKLSPQLNKNTSEKTQNNISKECVLDEKSDFKIENSSEDS